MVWKKDSRLSGVVSCIYWISVGVDCCAFSDVLKNDMNDTIKKIEQEKKLKQFLLSLGRTGEIADKVSDLILFHNRVRENAEKRYM